jgi:hypothetical protein
MPTYSGNKITVDSESKNIDIALSSGNAVLVSVEALAFSGTVDFQSTIDGVTYTNHPYIPYNDASPSRSISQLSSPTTYAAYVILPPVTQVRIAVAYTSGSLEVVWREIDYKSVDPTTAAAPGAHTIASHSDTTGTGAELEELTDGSETTLHSHADAGHGNHTGHITSTGLETALGSFTKAHLDTAVSDGNVTYDGDAPTAHAASHQNGGGDEVSVTGLSGLLADDQHVIDAEAVAAVEAAGLSTPALGTPSALVGTNISGTAAGLTAGAVTTNANLTGVVTSVGNTTALSLTKAQLDTAVSDGNPMFDGDAPTAHTVASHSDTTATGAELNELTDASETTLHSHAAAAAGNLTGHVTSTGLATILGAFTKAQLDAAVSDGNVTYDGDAPTAHASSHQNGGGDEVSVTGLSGLLADDQHVLDAEVISAVEAGTLSTVNIDGGTINGITDLAVADGGTGVSTLTDDGVLIGSGTGVIRATDAGTAGEVLTSGGAGVAPDWAAAAGGGDTVVSGSYTGNGSHPQTISGLGITPTMVGPITRADGSYSYWITAEVDAISKAFSFMAADTSEWVKNIQSGSFDVSNNLNSNGQTYYYVAIGS